MALAAAGDTWGIAGPVFLWQMFVPAAIALTVVAVLMRRAVSAGRETHRDLHPYEMAYLDQDRERVVAAALASLRAQGAIRAAASSRGVLRATGTRPTSGHPVDDAIYTTLHLSGGARPGELVKAHKVRWAVRDMANGLVREGLALGRADHLRRRLAVLPLVLLGAVGLARIFAGASNGKPVIYLVIVEIALALVAGFMLMDSWNNTTAGRRAIETARKRHLHLNPKLSPAWDTYGPTGAAFGVVLFGSAALVSIDPAFAEASEIHRQIGGSSSGSGGDGGGGSGGGGGGCGGGGGGGGGCGG